MPSDRTVPACNAEQVLCKRAQRKFLKQQRKSWMNQRAATNRKKQHEVTAKKKTKNVTAK